MKTTDMRAKARAIFGPAIAEPMPKQPNGAKALQQRANARPIPTYKVGGPVKKMPSPAASAASGNRMSREEADEMRLMEMMGMMEPKQNRQSMPMRSGKPPVYGVGKPAFPDSAASAASANRIAKQEADEKKLMDAMRGRDEGPRKPVTLKENPVQIDLDEKRKKVRLNEKRVPVTLDEKRVRVDNMEYKTGGKVQNMKMAEGGKMPDLTGDGKVTQADVLKGRGVKGFAKGGVQTSSDTARKLATEMGGMRKGGKVKPVELDMSSLEEMSRPRAALPNLESRAAEARNLNAVRGRETTEAAKGKSFKEAFNEARRDQGPNGVFIWRGNTYNTKMAGETSKGAPARAAAPTPNRAAAPAPASRPAATPPAPSANKPSNTGSPMSSVIRNLDTRSSIDAGALEARAKKIMDESGSSLFSSPKNKQQALEIARAEDEDRRNMSRYRAEQERKKRSLEAGRKANPDLVSQFLDMTMNPGYKKGGKVKEPKPKSGLAVMIAIGKPMKPAKKMNGGAMAGGSRDMEASKVTRAMAMGGAPMNYMGGGAPMGYAAGGAGKTRKGQAPIKKAQGGAAKVRKGMMTPEGNIIDAMNKMRGK